MFSFKNKDTPGPRTRASLQECFDYEVFHNLWFSTMEKFTSLYIVSQAYLSLSIHGVSFATL